ncbi:hypothetical protein ULMS_20050 [Patiriisocius marinistellae]|uniref:Transporter n=2 Tax=Patiriisocius marinistellae TaxID=2494560 RepID=A0A5J4FUY8_9FLAO|nr:hypothetical protein ULMS_20050 [Patiriisocius marinistellae]
MHAQYTETINNNRPGGSQGAFAVGTKVLQIEGGFGLGTEEHSLLQTETSAFAIDYAVRYGLFKEELEIIFNGEFQSNNITDTRTSTVGELVYSNFRSNTLGAKYLVYDPYRKRDLEGPNLYSWKANNKFQWRDLIPAISGYVGANFDFIDNPEGKFTNNYTVVEEGLSISPKVALITQNNFKSGFVLVTNIIANRVTTDNPEYGYIVTLTNTVTDWFSVFVENQGFKSDAYADQLLRGGAAALITRDLQVDASLLYSLKDTPTRLYGRIGVSYRFDMHDEDEFLEEKGKAGREKRRAEKDKNKKEKSKNKETKQSKNRKDGFEDDGDDGEGKLY